MKKKELSEHKAKPVAELQKEIQTQREKLNNLRFDLAAGKVKNIREIRQIKRNIAQILTLLTADKNKQNKHA